MKRPKRRFPTKQMPTESFFDATCSSASLASRRTSTFGKPPSGKITCGS
eukprot:CAMPEP_0184379190 /NCGR_PEP_ID=MMETSP0007-20130409/3641_1 /TAXON_ID=97485 /ORGANISM="Prymnesium parvum, Strain Texoma1" /LENGTH=48 /DNA_ID= /DNA_START= /DNA_END= /DNA_ORIENTATION=